MTAGWRQREAIRILSIVAAGAVMILAGCQSSPVPKHEKATASWQVLESRGDVSIDNDDIFLDKELRSGDRITGDNHVVMGRSSYLIASRSGLQLTATGKTSIILSGNSSSATLKPIYGTLRIRLAAAADDVKRIATPHLTASGTSAVLELSISDDGTEITVSSGNVALSTPDGKHHARLVAGATARLGDETRGHLEINADETAVSRLKEGPGGKPGHAELASKEQTKRSAPAAYPASKPMYRIEEPGEVAIRLASKPRSKKVSGSEQWSATDEGGQTETPSFKAAIMTTPASSDVDTTTEVIDLQQQFDGLTEGLLGKLPNAAPKPGPSP